MNAIRKKAHSIPVNYFEGDYHAGISIEKMSLPNLPDFKGFERSERHDRHTFHLLETGNITVEIDFQTYEIKAPTLLYIHPNQVHRIRAADHVNITSWAIDNVNLNPEAVRIGLVLLVPRTEESIRKRNTEGVDF